MPRHPHNQRHPGDPGDPGDPPYAGDPRHAGDNSRPPRPTPAARHLARLRTSPWVRLGLVLLAVGFCTYGLVAQRAEVTAALADLHWYSVVLAVVAAVIGLGAMMLAWRSLLADLGSHLPLRSAARIMFVGQLGKYLPGVVWAFAAQVELAREYNVPRRRSASATVISVAVTLATSLMVAAVTLPLTSHSAATRYWWILICAPLILFGLYPPLLSAALDLVLRLARQPPLEQRVSLPGLFRCIAWTAVGWAFFGLQLWLLVADVSGRGAGVLLLSVGAYTLAWSVGFLLVIFPSGVGPRELAMIAALAPIMPRGTALVVAIVSRLVLTVGDLAWAGLGLALGRGSAAPPPKRNPAVRNSSTTGDRSTAGDRADNHSTAQHPAPEPQPAPGPYVAPAPQATPAPPTRPPS